MMTLIIIFSALLGLVLGSFLNCLVWRLKNEEGIGGRSHCPQCRHIIRWYDNIPVLSFFILRGRCRDCHAAISWQYPLVEVIMALLFAAAVWRVGLGVDSPETWPTSAWLTIMRDWIFIFSLVAVFVTDLRWYLIFDQLTIPAGLVIASLNLALGMPWPKLLLSATIGTGFFLFQYLVSRGRWLGGGDIRLGFLLGAALGWPLVLPAIFSAYFIGALTGILLLAAAKKQWGSRLPLGTFLCVGALLALFYGQPLIDWYLRLITL